MVLHNVMHEQDPLENDSSAIWGTKNEHLAAEGLQKSTFCDVPFFHRFLIDLGAQNGANMRPKSHQDRSCNDVELMLDVEVIFCSTCGRPEAPAPGNHAGGGTNAPPLGFRLYIRYI